MEGFTYVDIFDTKGIEYLVVIAFLLMIVPFWILISRPLKLKAIGRALGVLSAARLRIPGGLFYSRNHTWTHMERSGEATIGLDDFLLRVTGDVEPVVLKSPGDRVKKGDSLAEIRQDGKSLKILSPISGTIAGRNPLLENNPALLGSDPYGEGWLFSIEPSDWLSESGCCYFAKQAEEWLGSEISRFKDFLAVSASRNVPSLSMVSLQDGGELVENVLAEMPDEVWSDFEKSFLTINVE